MNCDLEKDEFCKMWAKMNAKRIAAYRKAKKEKQEKYERISLLASTRELFRELAYRKGLGSKPETSANFKSYKDPWKHHCFKCSYFISKIGSIASKCYKIVIRNPTLICI